MYTSRGGDVQAVLVYIDLYTLPFYVGLNPNLEETLRVHRVDRLMLAIQIRMLAQHHIPREEPPYLRKANTYGTIPLLAPHIPIQVSLPLSFCHRVA